MGQRDEGRWREMEGQSMRDKETDLLPDGVEGMQKPRRDSAPLKEHHVGQHCLKVRGDLLSCFLKV